MSKIHPSNPIEYQSNDELNKLTCTGEKMPLVPPSVNFHLTKYCNMKCSFCYATFNDLGTVKHNLQKSRDIIIALADAGFEKLTFAGGEPTLVSELPELAELAKSLGLVTTIVTNGFKLGNPEYFDSLTPHLDWVAISIDSIVSDSNRFSGRSLPGGKTLSPEYHSSVIQKLQQAGIKTKINTVVSAFNHTENLTEFINACHPLRWKVLQALPVEGQNSEHFGKFEVQPTDFQAFLDRHNHVSKEIKIVAEEIDLIKGSYIMVNPKGQFYDNSGSAYTYSKSILEVGVQSALAEINFDNAKFLKRGGQYNW